MQDIDLMHRPVLDATNRHEPLITNVCYLKKPDAVSNLSQITKTNLKVSFIFQQLDLWQVVRWIKP
jgi:hypothetical protein